MKLRKLFCVMVMLSPIVVWSSTFKVKTKEGVLVTYSVVDEVEKTCQVGGYYEYDAATYMPAIDYDYDGFVTIPSEVKGYTVIGLCEKSFYQCWRLSGIVIPPTVTYIGREAFCYAENLYDINIPDCLTSIEDLTFGGCHRLSHISIPKTVKTIGRGAFADCRSVTELIIPEGVEEIDKFAFGGCSNLINIVIPSTVKNIGDYAFNDSGYSQTIVKVGFVEPLPITINTFHLHPFMTLLVPKGSITAFESADNWKDFGTISEYSPLIVFSDPKVKQLCVYSWDTNGDGELDEDEAAAVTDLGDVFKGYEITSFDELKYFTGLTRIGRCAFQNCSELTSITLPDNLTIIGQSAFSRCSSLASVVIPNGVTSIENEAFYECCGLTSVTIGSSIEAIGDNAFYKCTGLTSVVLPDSVKSLGWGTFAYCSGVTSVNIPSSVTSIQYSAFDYCGGLTSLKVEDGNSVYDSRDNCNAIIETATNTLAHGCMNTVIPNDVKAIGYSAFDGCSGLTSIAIPHTVASIGDFAFGGCDNLSSVTVERATPVIIISSTFSNCGNAILYVPYGSKSTYEAADYWKNFKEIMAQGEMSVDKPPCSLTKYLSATELISEKSVTFAPWQRDIHHSTTRRWCASCFPTAFLITSRLQRSTRK